MVHLCRISRLFRAFGDAHSCRLESLPPTCLGHESVTDTGLMELARLKQLQWLGLNETKVTDKGVQELKKALPQVQIVR